MSKSNEWKGSVGWRGSFSGGLGLIWLIFIILFLFVVNQYFPKVFNIDKDNFELKIIIFLAGLDFAFSLPIIVFQAMIKAKQEFLTLNTVLFQIK